MIVILLLIIIYRSKITEKSYKMGAGFEQRPWTPTVRRGPIAAEMKSPAPNSVDLPPLLGEYYHIYITVIYIYMLHVS